MLDNGKGRSSHYSDLKCTTSKRMQGKVNKQVLYEEKKM